MTVAARIDPSLTLSQMMDLMAGVDKTGVLLHVVPTCRYVAAAILQALAFRSLNSGFQRTRTMAVQSFEIRETWSRIVTAMQLLIGSMKGTLSPPLSEVRLSVSGDFCTEVVQVAFPVSVDAVMCNCT